MSDIMPFDTPLPRTLRLKSGDLTCLYEYGRIRYLRAHSRETLRMIYTAVRDAQWNTAPYTIENETVKERENGFSIQYTALYKLNDISYKADVRIEAEGNQLKYAMSGEALSDFKRNRIGICVLHGIDSIAGQEIAITKPSGDKYIAVFPHLISPHQPAKEIRKMLWQTPAGDKVELAFSGDTFETEDQRNWTDSSFKTYSTPLDLPMPVQVNKGDTIHQEVHVIIQPGTNEVPGKKASSIDQQGKFPPIGYCKTPGRSLTNQEAEWLKALPLDHYRVELDMTSNVWKKEITDAKLDAQKLGTRLQLVCLFDEQYQQQLSELLEQVDEEFVTSILVLDKTTNRTNNDHLLAAHTLVRKRHPSIALGYGVNFHFADLNRNLPGPVPFDFVSFSITPQAHSTDTRSILENLDNQSDLLLTLRSKLGNVKVHVSPVSFKPRKQVPPSAAGVPGDMDERLHLSFGAVWTYLALKNLADATVTLYDAVGYKGVINDRHLQKGEASPLYEMLKKIGSNIPIEFDPLYINYR